VTQYHPSSFAHATAAVADDLERLATELHRSGPNLPGVFFMAVLDRLDLQVAALREIARRQYAQDWGRHEAVGAGDPKSCGGYDVDPDLEGPSWDDAPDEPRRRS